jgi:hypothetical protein
MVSFARYFLNLGHKSLPAFGFGMLVLLSVNQNVNSMIGIGNARIKEAVLFEVS